MSDQQAPLYVSKACFKSFGNEYRVFEDRIELRARFLFRTFVVSRDDLVSIGIYPPPVVKTVFWALKLDLADLYEHVGIERRTGWFKKLRFTPANPQEFVAKVKECFRI